MLRGRRAAEEGSGHPVFHDDQHGTAVVVLAALINSLKIVGKDFEGLRIVVNGVGASGWPAPRSSWRRARRTSSAATRRHRPRRTRGPQRVQALVRREHEPRGKDRRSRRPSRGRPLPRALGAGRAHHRTRREHEGPHLRDGQPRPRDKARVAMGKARIIATGRSDYPNQINNVLCFPGIFRAPSMLGPVR